MGHPLKAETIGTHISRFPALLRESLEGLFYDLSFEGRIDGDFAGRLGIPFRRLMSLLLPVARAYAIADFQVGAITQGASGDLYFGANREIPKAPLAWTLHAEQSAVLGAFAAGEKGITRIAVTAPPCGQCRQFLYELTRSSTLNVYVERQNAVTLSKLFPKPFGPRALGKTPSFLAHEDWPFADETDAFTNAAITALRRSYSPYLKSPSAVAFEIEDGTFLAAPYVENVAYNPSVAPMVAAIDRLRFSNPPAAIRKALLVESMGSNLEQESSSREILRAIGSKVDLAVLKIRFSK